MTKPWFVHAGPARLGMEGGFALGDSQERTTSELGSRELIAKVANN